MKYLRLLSKRNQLVTIHGALSQSRNGKLKDDFFLGILEENFSDDEAREQFDTAVNWGRYADLFEYDLDEHELRLNREDKHSVEEGEAN